MLDLAPTNRPRRSHKSGQQHLAVAQLGRLPHRRQARGYAWAQVDVGDTPELLLVAKTSG
jgi:hypothetical protein